MTTPPIPAPVFTINGQEVKVGSPQFNDAEGGYDQCSGAIDEADWRRIGSPSQGEMVRVYAGGKVVWSGRFAQPPQRKRGVAYFNAVGHNQKAAKKGERLFLQSCDMSLWVPYDSAPHLNATTDVPVYDRVRKINLDSSKGALRFSLNGNQNLATGDAACFIFYAEGVDIDIVSWTQTYNAADEFAKLDIRLQRANGPIGAETNTTTVLLNTANNGSQRDEVIGVSGNDLVTLGLHCNDGTFTPNANAMRWMLTQVSVSSERIAGVSSYDANTLMGYIGGQMGWDVSGVASTTYNILPFDWDNGSFLDAMLYAAELEDNFVRVGDEALEYNAWGTTTWTVTQTVGAEPDLKPLELYNQARVFYETGSGVARKKLRTYADAGVTDPLSSSGITNTIEYELEDPQRNDTLAQNVADKLVTRYAKQRYAGTVHVAAAVDDDGNTNVRNIRYGDILRITDWGSAEKLELRVIEVSQDDRTVTVGVEQPVNLPALIAHTHGKKKRGPRKGNR